MSSLSLNFAIALHHYLCDVTFRTGIIKFAEKVEVELHKTYV